MRKIAPDQNAFEFLQTVLATDGWGEMDILQDGRTLRGIFEGNQGKFWVYAKIPAAIDVLLCFSRCPFDAPLDLLPLAAELVARINFGLRVGNFEVDMDGGEIRFRSSLDFRNLTLSDTLILNVLLPCAFAMDRFLPAFEALVVEREPVASSLARIPE